MLPRLKNHTFSSTKILEIFTCRLMMTYIFPPKENQEERLSVFKDNKFLS